MSAGKAVLGCALGIGLLIAIGSAISATMDGYQNAKNKAETPSAPYSSRTETESRPETSRKSQEEVEKEYKDNCRPITYEQIMRETDMMKGQYVTTTGKVSQVMPDGILRVDLTKDEYGLYSDSIVVYYSSNDSGFNVIEGDIITVWGTANGAEIFKSSMLENEREIEVATIGAKYIELQESKNE